MNKRTLSAVWWWMGSLCSAALLLSGVLGIPGDLQPFLLIVMMLCYIKSDLLDIMVKVEAKGDCRK